MTEMSRPVALDRIGAAGAEWDVQAEPAELGPIAARLLLPAVAVLRCHFRLRRLGGSVIAASGALSATVTRVCVVSLDEFQQEVAEEFELRFVPAGDEAEGDDPEAPDEIPFTGGAVDLGEAAVEQLALALDPYPRRPDLPPDALDPPEGDAPHPFGALAALRRPQ